MQRLTTTLHLDSITTRTMKKVLLGLTVSLTLIVPQGQAQSTFQKTFGGTNTEECHSVCETTDGGYILVGYTNSFGEGGSDTYLIRINGNGDTVWTKTYGGTNSDYGHSVQQTMDGGYIITGQTLSFGSGNYDVYLIRTDGNGNTLWTKTFGGTSYDYGSFVQQTTDGGYVIAGVTSSFGAGADDVYVIRTDGNGDTLWTKTFGGWNFDYGNSVQQTVDGGYVVIGSTQSFGSGFYDAYLIKTDGNGDTLWTKTFGGVNYDYGSSIQQTIDGGYVITGSERSFGAGFYDVYLIRTDGNGNSLWAKTFGGGNYEYGQFVRQTTDGGYVITGATWSFGAGGIDVFLIRTDGNGDTLWTRTFGGISDEEGYCVWQTADGRYVITGYINSYGSGDRDVYLIKTDSNGNSGCNETNPNTVVTTPTTLLSNPSTQVSSGGNIGNPATQTGSGGIITTLCSTAGINESNFKDNFINIYPNPFSSQTTLQTVNSLRNATLTVDNCFGQTVAQIKNLNGQTIVFNRDHLASGLYFVRLTEDNKTIAVDKLVIADK